MSYLSQGFFPLRDGVLYGPEQGVLLQWGMWEQPDADNDDEWTDPPVSA